MLIFADAFDSYTATADILRRWDFHVGNTPAVSTTNGRTGGGCLASGVNGGTLCKAFPAQSSLFIAASIFIPSTEPYDRAICAMFNADVSGVGSIDSPLQWAPTTLTAYINASGFIEARRFNSIVGTGTTVVSKNAWHRIEMFGSIDNTTGRFVIKMDGVTEIDFTGDTYQTGNLTFVQCGFHRHYMRHDDMMIWNEQAGDGFTTFLGDLIMDTLRPSADGSSLELTTSTGTTHFNLVNEQVDNTTNFVTGDVAGLKDLYAYGNMVSTPATIFGVVVGAMARSGGTQARTVKQATSLSGTEVQSTNLSIRLNEANYGLVQAAFTTKPGGGAWTKADVDAAEYGLELTS